MPNDQLSIWEVIMKLQLTHNCGAALVMLPVLAGYTLTNRKKPGLVSGFVAGNCQQRCIIWWCCLCCRWWEKTLSGWWYHLVSLSLVGGFLAGAWFWSFKITQVCLAHLKVFAPSCSCQFLRSCDWFPCWQSISLCVSNQYSPQRFLLVWAGSSAFFGLVGGMMAVDKGGPVNKAAYAFGTSNTGKYCFNWWFSSYDSQVPPLAVFVRNSTFRKINLLEERDLWFDK